MIVKNQVLYRDNEKPIVWDASFNCNTEQKPIVIFCHGYKGFKDWGCWDIVANHFSSQDFFFLKFNFSHNGGTVVNPIDFPDLEAFAENNYSQELEDLDCMLNYLLSQEFEYKSEINQTNIILIGHSRGGGISIIKASEDKRITKLVTWASVSDFGSRFGSQEDILMWKKNGVKHVLNGRTKQKMPHNFQFFKNFKENEQRLHIKSAIQNLEIPILIIHDKEDQAVLFKEAQNLNAWNSCTTLITVTGSNHVFGASHPWSKKQLPKALTNVVKHTLEFIKI